MTNDQFLKSQPYQMFAFAGLAIYALELQVEARGLDACGDPVRSRGAPGVRFPGRYPGRPPHLYIKVSAPGCRSLTTQGYTKLGQAAVRFNIVLQTAQA